MSLVTQLNSLCRHLEEEYYDDAIKVIFLFDADIRWLVIGIDHPLWDCYLVKHCILPKTCYKRLIDNMVNDIRLDLRHIDKFIRDNYEKGE